MQGTLRSGSRRAPFSAHHNQNMAGAFGGISLRQDGAD